VSVGIVEVSPRDGLQDESVVVPTEVKVALIEQALDAGLVRVEAASFAHPDRVPTMADAEAVLARVARRPDVRLSGLVLNERGLDRALAAGVDEINVVVLVTETFSRRNQALGVEEALSMWSRVAVGAAGAGVGATVTLAAAFGCPYEGRVDPRVADEGPIEIALADTIGCAIPPEVGALVGGVADDTGLPVRIHLHNSRNTGYANALAAIDGGASSIDASIGGIGGCPFAPGASGNIATEDLVHLLDRMDIPTGVRLEPLLATSHWLEEVLDHPVPGQLGRSGPFPPASPRG
jgi:hydroxymethylglutaryl-CoA lyase